MFRSATAIHSAPTTTTGGMMRVGYVKYPAAGPEGRYALAITLIKLYNKGGPQGYETTASYILTVGDLIFPGLVESVRLTAGIEIATISNSTDPDWFDEDFDYDNSNKTVAARKTSHLDIGLFTDVSVPGELFGLDEAVIAGRWGVEMFPIGKNVSALNLTAFTVNRCRAIIQKYELSDAAQRFFRDDYSPTLAVLKAISTTFTVYPPLRLGLASVWISWLNSTNTIGNAAFSTTFQLTDGYGFNAPDQINNLLIAYPILVEYPPLAPLINKYRAALAEYLSKPAVDRGFLKVKYGDKYALFKESNRGMLIKVAIIYARQSSETIGKFINTDDAVDFTNALNVWLIARGQEPIKGVGKTEGSAATRAGA